jgi:hypothetical protein
MSKKSCLFSCAALALVFSVQQLPAFAQGYAPTGWEANQQSLITQDAAAGLINSGQAAQLENRESQIQAQQQAYMAQNGGRLTGQEQQQIDSELRGVNKHMGHDVRRDMQNNPAAMSQFMQGNPNLPWGMQRNVQNMMGQTGYNPQWQNNGLGPMVNPQMINQQMINPPMGQFQNGSQPWSQQNQGQFGHHHHHGEFGGGFNGSGVFGGGNGGNGGSYGGSNNFQGRSWNGNGQ